MLPSKFALVFDGWTCEKSTTHYLAVSASFLGDDEKPETVLLAFTPFEDESSFTASDHKETLVSILELHHKTLEIGRASCRERV